MSNKHITPALVEQVRAWLGKEGRAFFRQVKQEHGTLNACWIEDGIPHPVYFREGMQVRNFLRGTGLCEGWTDHDLDDNWIPVVEKAIGPEGEGEDDVSSPQLR